MAKWPFLAELGVLMTFFSFLLFFPSHPYAAAHLEVEGAQAHGGYKPKVQYGTRIDQASSPFFLFGTSAMVHGREGRGP